MVDFYLRNSHNKATSSEFAPFLSAYDLLFMCEKKVLFNLNNINYVKRLDGLILMLSFHEYLYFMGLYAFFKRGFDT